MVEIQRKRQIRKNEIFRQKRVGRFFNVIFLKCDLIHLSNLFLFINCFPCYSTCVICCWRQTKTEKMRWNRLGLIWCGIKWNTMEKKMEKMFAENVFIFQTECQFFLNFRGFAFEAINLSFLFGSSILLKNLSWIFSCWHLLEFR